MLPDLFTMRANQLERSMVNLGQVDELKVETKAIQALVASGMPCPSVWNPWNYGLLLGMILFAAIASSSSSSAARGEENP